MALLILLELVIAGAIAGARYVYFGNFVPQPVSAKVGGVYPSGSLASSLLYVAEYGYANQLSVILVVAGTLALGYDVLRRKRALDLPGVVLLALLVAQLALMLSVGVDWMEGHRFLAPLVPLAVIFLVYWMSQYMTRQVVVLVFAVLTVFQAATTVKFAQVSSTSMPIWKALALDAGAVHAMATIAYLGPEQTNTHLAARCRFGPRARYVHVPTVEDVFELVERRPAVYGVVPIENSLEGAVTHTLDRFVDFVDTPVRIQGEVEQPIRHALIMRRGIGLEGVREVYSHPQALAQYQRELDRLVQACDVPLHDAQRHAT